MLPFRLAARERTRQGNERAWARGARCLVRTCSSDICLRSALRSSSCRRSRTCASESRRGWASAAQHVARVPSPARPLAAWHAPRCSLRAWPAQHKFVCRAHQHVWRPGAMCAPHAHLQLRLGALRVEHAPELGLFLRAQEHTGHMSGAVPQYHHMRGRDLGQFKIERAIFDRRFTPAPRVVFSRDGVREGERQVARVRARASLTDSRRPRRTDRG